MGEVCVTEDQQQAQQGAPRLAHLLGTLVALHVYPHALLNSIVAPPAHLEHPLLLTLLPLLLARLDLHLALPNLPRDGYDTQQAVFEA